MVESKNLKIIETFNLAVKNHQENKIDIAQELYNQVLKVDPNHLGTLNNLGVIFKKINEYQTAKDCYEKIIQIDPNNFKTYYNLGNIFKELGEHQRAKDSYESAIKIEPNFVDAHNNLGVLYKELNQIQKAKNCYEKAIELNPNYVEAHYNLGNIFQELGEHQKAKDFFEKAIELNPNHLGALNNLGNIFKELRENRRAKDCYEKVIKINPDSFSASSNIANIYVNQLTDFEITISKSNEALKIYHKNYKFINQSIPLFKLKHDIEQANYLISKNYKINGIDEFIKIADEILGREENKNNLDKKILLNKNEINMLLSYSKENHIYQTKTISESCINPNKNWLDVENEYFNSSNQIMYIDDFLSDEALIELREFCLVSKVWHKAYDNKYIGAFSNSGFISSIHLQIAMDLQQKLPKLFGPYKLEKFWAFKYDSTLGKGINIHADFAFHNLNFWITPDKFNNNKNSGGLKVYDVPAPDNWTFKDYNTNPNKVYSFLKDNNANCINIPYKFNRAVLFNSAYFHETDNIDFKDVYEGRRINNTYLFGNRLVKKN